MKTINLRIIFFVFLCNSTFISSANTLDFYLNEAAVGKTPAPYIKLNEFSKKKQILISECMKLHNLKFITAFRIADYLEKNQEKVADATLYIEQANRFNDRLSKTYDCSWTTQNYVIQPLE